MRNALSDVQIMEDKTPITVRTKYYGMMHYSRVSRKILMDHDGVGLNVMALFGSEGVHIHLALLPTCLNRLMLP